MNLIINIYVCLTVANCVLQLYVYFLFVWLYYCTRILYICMTVLLYLQLLPIAFIL